MIKLYDFQQKAINAVEGSIAFGSKTIIIEAPTGSGKSLLIAELAKKLSKDKPIIIMVNISALMMQISEHLDMLKVKHSILWAQKPDLFDVNCKIQLTMAQTLHSRIKKENPFDIDMINGIMINDEVHREWKTNRTKDILDIFSPDIRIGLSATPYDDKGMELSGVDDIIRTATVQELVENKYLAPIKYFVPKWSQEIDYEKIRLSGYDYSSEGIEELIGTKEYAQMVATSLLKLDPNQNKKTIIFANSIAHSDLITEELKKAGFRAFSYHSKSDAASLTQMESFKNNKPINIDLINEQQEPMKVVVSVMKISIGFNVKDVDIGVLCRPTRILSLAVQQIGRIMRTASNKKYGMILDLAGILSRLGFPDEPYIPAKTKEERIKKTQERHLNVIDSIIDKQDEPVEITKEIVIKKLEEIKKKKEDLEKLTVQELLNLFSATVDINLIVCIGAEIQRRKIGIVISRDTCKWISDNMIKMIEDFPEYEYRLIKTFKTRTKNVVARNLKLASLYYFVDKDGWLRDQSPYKFANEIKEARENGIYDLVYEDD